MRKGWGLLSKGGGGGGGGFSVQSNVRVMEVDTPTLPLNDVTCKPGPPQAKFKGGAGDEVSGPIQRKLCVHV